VSLRLQALIDIGFAGAALKGDTKWVIFWIEHPGVALADGTVVGPISLFAGETVHHPARVVSGSAAAPRRRMAISTTFLGGVRRD